MAYKPARGGLVTGIQGQLLQINVVGCRHLTDKEWFSRQDPYVTVEYATSRFRTRTDTDGGKNPTFNEKFTVPLIEGLRELNVQVWNSNTVSFDDYIGTTKVLLEKVLSTGYDDSSWALKSKHGKTAGEVNLILHYSNSKIQREDQYGGVGYGAGYPPAHGAYPPSGFPPGAYGQPGGYAAQGAPTGYSPAHGPSPGYAPAPSPGYPPPQSYPSSPSYQSGPSGYPPQSGYPPSAASYSAGQSSHGASYPAPSGYHPAPGYPPSGYPPAGHSAQQPAPGGQFGAPPPVYGHPPGGYPGYNPSY